MVTDRGYCHSLSGIIGKNGDTIGWIGGSKIGAVLARG